MTIVLAIICTLMVCSVAIIGFLFNVLNKKFEKYQSQVDKQLVLIDEKFGPVEEHFEKVDERFVKITDWCETLKENEDALLKDLKHLFHDYKKKESTEGEK